MKKWLQRIRGAMGIGMTWGAGWAPVGALTGLVTGTLLGFPLGTVIVNYAVTFGVLGFIGGGLFSTVLGLAEGRRSFEELSLPRSIMWGASGGLVLGALTVGIGVLGAGLSVLGAAIIGASALLGASSAGGTFVIARSAQGHALIEGREDLADPVLHGENAQKRLGETE